MTATQLIRQALESGRWMLTSMLADMEGPTLVYRGAGGRGNHALWLLGHTAGGEAVMAGWIGADVQVPPPGDPTLFAMGSTPLSDASAYPGKQALLDYAAAVRQRVLAFLETVSDGDLDRPADTAPDFFKTHADVWKTIVMHEMMHVGQLSAIRKELALPAVLG